jgi:hypothetical protein
VVQEQLAKAMQVVRVYLEVILAEQVAVQVQSVVMHLAQ